MRANWLLGRRSLAPALCLVMTLTSAGSAWAREPARIAEMTQVVSLSASASQEVPQDWLVMRLSVIREGSDAGQVQAQMRTALDAALDMAKARATAQGMEVRTGQFGLHPRYGSNGRINGWQGRAELVLQGRDFALIARTAAEIPQMTVSSSQFVLSAQARQALEAQVQRQAIERFRQRAADIANAFGFTDYTLGHVSVGDASGSEPPRPMMLAHAAKAFEADASVPVEAGKEAVQVTVSGSIHLR